MSAIRQMMATDMITASPDETVAAVAGRMCKNRVGAVLVVRDGVLLGLFSERDLLVRVIVENRSPSEVKVGEVATADVLTVNVDQPVKEMLRLFREKRFRHLPVMEGGKPVGILSTRDLLERSVDALEGFIERKAYGGDLKDGADPYDHFGGAYTTS